MKKVLALGFILALMFAVNAECSDEKSGKITLSGSNIATVTVNMAILGSGFIKHPQKEYKLDFKGREFGFQNAKPSYKAGEQVVLYFDMIATDTNYTFYVDGEVFNPDYDSSKGYIISFTMPEHDVAVEVESRNTMVLYE